MFNTYYNMFWNFMLLSIFLFYPFSSCFFLLFFRNAFIYFFSLTISTEEQAQKSYCNMLLIILVIIPALLSSFFIVLILVLITYFVGNAIQYFYESFFFYNICRNYSNDSLLMTIFKITVSFYIYYFDKYFLKYKSLNQLFSWLLIVFILLLNHNKKN